MSTIIRLKSVRITIRKQVKDVLFNVNSLILHLRGSIILINIRLILVSSLVKRERHVRRGSYVLLFISNLNKGIFHLVTSCFYSRD